MHGGAAEPGCDAAFGAGEQGHDDHGGCGDCDSENAFGGRFVAEQRGDGTVRYIGGQDQKADSDGAMRSALGAFVVQAPKNSCAGRDLNYAVEAEAEQRKGTGGEARGDRDQGFHAVPGDGEVFEALAAAYVVQAIDIGGGGHASIIAASAESGAGFHSGPLGAVARLWLDDPKQSQVSFAPERREKRRSRHSWRTVSRATK